MSDHADTIRRALEDQPTTYETLKDALAALDALLAERQQLQKERDRLEIERDNWKQSEFNERGRRLAAETRGQQAIDALRLARPWLSGSTGGCGEKP